MSAKTQLIEQLKGHEGAYDGVTLTADKEIFLLHTADNKESGNVDIEILRNGEVEAVVYDAYPQTLDEENEFFINEAWESVNGRIADFILEVDD